MLRRRSIAFIIASSLASATAALAAAPGVGTGANGVPFIKKKTPTGAAAQPVQLMGGGAGIGTPMSGGGGGGGGNPPAGPPNL